MSEIMNDEQIFLKLMIDLVKYKRYLYFKLAFQAQIEWLSIKTREHSVIIRDLSLEHLVKYTEHCTMLGEDVCKEYGLVSIDPKDICTLKKISSSSY